MKLITQAILKKAPALYANEDRDPADIKIVAKFFTPWSSWTWYMVEMDPETELAYGWVINTAMPDCAGLGHFSIAELRALRSPLGLTVERDLYYGTHTLADVMAGEATAQ